MDIEHLPDDVRFIVRAANKIPSMLAYWNAELVCRFANRAYSVWFGVEPDALVGASLRDLLGDELFALNEPYVFGALAGQAQTFERIVPGPDGVNRHSLAHYIPDIADGQVQGFVAHVTEVTMLQDRQAALRNVIQALEAEVDVHRRAEESLGAGHLRLEEASARIAGEKNRLETALKDVTRLAVTVAESVVDHIAVLDQRGYVTATNSAWREFADLRGNFVKGSVPRSDVGADYLVECRDVVGPVSPEAVQAAEGIAAVLAGRLDLYTLEYKWHDPVGERCFLMSATRLQTSDGGAVIVHANIAPGAVRRPESAFAESA